MAEVEEAVPSEPPLAEGMGLVQSLFRGRNRGGSISFMASQLV